MQGRFSRRPIAGVVLVLMGFVLGACGETAVDPMPEAAGTLTGFPDEPVADPARIGRLMGRSCAFCHIDGNAGAPVIGDQDEWTARLVKGRDELLANTLNGIGDMPPLGYCMACTTDDFEALIDLLVGDAVAARPLAEDGT